MNTTIQSAEEKIVTGLLTGQSKVMVNQMEIILPTLPRDTTERRNKLAMAKAKEIMKIVLS